MILKKDRSNTCLFLKERSCSVHAAKPYQCRETPFVPEFFTDPVWRTEAAARCPALAGNAYRFLADPVPAGDRDEPYRALLREHAYNLEEILGVTLPAPRIIPASELS